jgi:hypothetical protein
LIQKRVKDKLTAKNMKIIFFLILLPASIIFPQQNKTKDLLALKNEIKMPANILPQTSLNSQADFKKKNAGLAILYSVLLPGMGELYAESYSSGKYFTIAEGAMLISYFGLNAYGNWQEDRYKSFAAANGGIDLAGKDEDYFAIIGEYNSIEDYNNSQALDRNFPEMYEPAAYYWKWETSDERRTYRNMWVSSEQAFNNLRFVVGAMILNRIVSAINAVRLVAAYNKSMQEDVSWNFSVGINRDIAFNPLLTFNFQSSF